MEVITKAKSNRYQSIMENERLDPEAIFKFSCHKDIACFNRCCRNLYLPITPYDVLRMKNRLKISSDEFLGKYALYQIEDDSEFPVVTLKMKKNAERTCPFVTPEGCTIYEDRPTACRTYPLGRAASENKFTDKKEEFFFIIRKPNCLGFQENKEWTIKEWQNDQGLPTYYEMNDLLMDIVFNKNRRRQAKLDDRQMQMFFVACYNLESFLSFIFESRFLDTFDIKQEVLEKITKDEVALMKFGLDWLKFSLYGEDTIKLKVKAHQATKLDPRENKI